MIFLIIIANYFVVALICYLAVIFSVQKLADGDLVEALCYSYRMSGEEPNKIEETTFFNLSSEDSCWLLVLLNCIFWPGLIYAFIKLKVNKTI